MPATHPYIPRIVVFFDFDRTLASDTIDAMCEAWGLSREEWEERYEEPLGEHWDGILRRGQACLDCGRDRGEPVSDAFFRKAAGHIRIYDGLEQLRGRLEEAIGAVKPGIELELVVLSSGFIEIIKETPVADWFDHLWAGGFHSGEDGEAIAMKRIIGHPEKARYIEGYAKGLDLDQSNEPQIENPEFNDEDMHVLFDQIIYVGDGASDLDSFGFVTQHGGVAIAINKSASFEYVDQQMTRQRADDLAPPDYSEGGELLIALCHAVRSAASRIAIRELAQGE